jgi:hypothetical protein
MAMPAPKPTDPNFFALAVLSGPTPAENRLRVDRGLAYIGEASRNIGDVALATVGRSAEAMATYARLQAPDIGEIAILNTSRETIGNMHELRLWLDAIGWSYRPGNESSVKVCTSDYHAGRVAVAAYRTGVYTVYADGEVIEAATDYSEAQLKVLQPKEWTEFFQFLFGQAVLAGVGPDEHEKRVRRLHRWHPRYWGHRTLTTQYQPCTPC